MMLRDPFDHRLASDALRSDGGTKTPTREHCNQMGRIVGSKQSPKSLHELGKRCGILVCALALLDPNGLDCLSIKQAKYGSTRRNSSAEKRVFFVSHARTSRGRYKACCSTFSILQPPYISIVYTTEDTRFAIARLFKILSELSREFPDSVNVVCLRRYLPFLHDPTYSRICAF